MNLFYSCSMTFQQKQRFPLRSYPPTAMALLFNYDVLTVFLVYNLQNLNLSLFNMPIQEFRMQRLNSFSYSSCMDAFISLLSSWPYKKGIRSGHNSQVNLFSQDHVTLTLSSGAADTIILYVGSSMKQCTLELSEMSHDEIFKKVGNYKIGFITYTQFSIFFIKLGSPEMSCVNVLHFLG